ncbi:MAG TPA: glycosyl hydrolase, partial [Gemmataceae bacterium]|nr:glycosyl hydrolase [Gemmataceae bacterium]
MTPLPINRRTFLLAGCSVLVRPAVGPAAEPEPLAWPATTAAQRPWTRWWWLGSAVDRENLTRSLEQFKQAGIGGVEICPIYGAKGSEDKFIDFLSPKWMEMLAHTTAEAKRLGIGVDLTTGTGWPFGGPDVTADDASARVVLKAYDLAEGKGLGEKLPEGKLHAVVAVAAGGERIDLTAKVKDGRLDWTAPAGKWKLYAVVQQSPVMKVKRAAPGGVGNVLDPFSPAKLDRYLARFDKAFAGFTAPMPRAHFHDSYEYYNASWTDDLLDEFRKRRGYDLKAQLPALFGDGPVDTVARVKCDYRETLSDLHREYLLRWTEWCHQHGGRSRNQAHGGPGNIIDAYAAADIPECEIYSHYAERNRPFLKMASSAAHLTGRTLVSAESFTWLGEHFQVPLSKVKPAADYLFLAGVNHLFFHGIPYSPEGVPWPGWQFYAAVNFGPHGGLWRDLGAFNAYVARCQSILQAGKPANDVLLYVPFHDVWQSPDGLVKTFVQPGTWMEPFPVHATAMALENRGYTYDLLSDRLLADAKVEKGAVLLGGNRYQAIVVPKCRVIPETTVKKLVDLARDGATVAFLGGLPTDVPGLGELEKRRGELREVLKGIDTQAAKFGAGKILTGDDVDAVLRAANVAREPFEAGIRF